MKTLFSASFAILVTPPDTIEMNNKLCFFIDDDPDDHEMFQVALDSSNLPVQVVTATNGKTALQKLESESFVPDFIFLDLNMPLMGGKEFLQEIKSRNRFKHIPVYIYTTSVNEKEKAETRALGAVDFIIKPTDIDDIAKTIETVLNTLPEQQPNKIKTANK